MSTAARAPDVDEAIPTPGELVDRAGALVPALRARAAAAEDARRIPDETMAELFDAGLLRYHQPRRYGGYAMGWGVQALIGRELARGCGSTAWIASVVGTHSYMVGRFPPEAQEDVWGGQRDVLISTGAARSPETTITRTAGGCRVTGMWRFASGIEHAGWSILTGPVTAADGGTPDGRPELSQLLIPRSDYRAAGTWAVAGLRGTGSLDVLLDDVFVPEHRMLPFAVAMGADPPGAAVDDAYVFRVALQPFFGTTLLGPILGAAEGALHDYTEATRVREGAVFRERVAEQVPVQTRLAESAAEVDAAALVLERMLEVLDHHGRTGEPLTDREQVRILRDRGWIARTCVAAVHRLVTQMGASGLTDANPVQRHSRDLLAMTAQIGVQWDRCAAPFGRWALGLEPQTPMV